MTDNQVVITGIGMVTPLGMSPLKVLTKLRDGATVRRRPEFDTQAFDCPFCARVEGVEPEAFFPENKTLRLMNRDAQLAAVAAQLAMQDAAIIVDETYAGDEIALFGATGVAGLSLEETAGIVRHASTDEGAFDLRRFGSIALKRVRPVISFKILASMPICFVSIFQNIRGPNAIYSPWEGNGAHALAEGIRAIQRADVPCALVGGCDVKTHILSFINLQQLGIFNSWKQTGDGCIPAEGSVFLVLEEEKRAAARNKKTYARIQDYHLYSTDSACAPDIFSKALAKMAFNSDSLHLVSAEEGHLCLAAMETDRLKSHGIKTVSTLRPKAAMGNLFAAAAFAQVGLAAALAQSPDFGGQVLADCIGYGSEQAMFVLEAV